ncbi:MAG: hypothetical protein II414_04795, partial [Erysipelotrichaceae bacterium]|nr:hypothetical protein [Erysipelotrichaceae bacterium]
MKQYIVIHEHDNVAVALVPLPKGFVLADGPEVEDDLHIFTKMNFAADHPARDMQDTFFVSQHPD